MTKSKEQLQEELATLEGEAPEGDTTPADAINPAVEERRAKFTGAQRRLAWVLSWGGKYSDMINSGRTDPRILSDKLVFMQIIRLMLDDDGNDGILYAVTGWKSTSNQTLAERMGNHPCNHECNPQWRLGMQTPERQEAYSRREAQALKLPYTEPRPPLKLDAKALVRMSSEEFAAFVVEFHRQVLDWDLKRYVYTNLETPAAEFFEGFVRLQREADAQEETLYKGSYAAHALATAPDGTEEDAREFLDLLASMAQREREEEARRAERIATQKPRDAAPVPKEPTVPEPETAKRPWDSIDINAIDEYYARQIEDIKAEQATLAAEQEAG